MAIHNQKKEKKNDVSKRVLIHAVARKKQQMQKNQMPGFGLTEENGRSQVEPETSQNKDFKLDE
uniref:Uncharacterized protein n=1 Tax=Solanum tuberosum TaxID=4113 RepID=M1A131_SOLTU